MIGELMHIRVIGLARLQSNQIKVIKAIKMIKKNIALDSYVTLRLGK